MKKNGQKNLLKKLFLLFGLAFFGLVVLALLVLLWIKNGDLTSGKLFVLKNFSFPVATVEKSPIWSRDFVLEVELTQAYEKLIGSNSEFKKPAQVLDSLIERKKLDILAGEKNIQVTKDRIEQEYLTDTENFKENSDKTLKEFLYYMQISENYYKNVLLSTELKLAGVRQWFFSQKNLNEKAYKTAEQILKLHSEKIDLGALAKTYSQDASSRTFSGDLGQVKLNQLLESR